MTIEPFAESSFEADADGGTRAEVASPDFMRGALLSLGVGALAFLVVLRWAAPEQTMRLLFPALAAVLALVSWRVLVVRGVWHAKRVLGLGGWLLAVVACFFNGGVLTPAVLAFPVLLVMIGWLFSPRAAVWVGGLTIVALWAMVAGDAAGWLPEQPLTTPLMYAVIQSVMLVLTVYMTLFVVRSYRGRMRQVGRTADQLTLRTRELEASKRRLQTAIDVSGTVFWEYDLSTDTLAYETSQLHALGLRADRPPLTLYRWLALVHPDDRPGFLEQYQQTLSGAAPAFDHDCRVQGSHGEWVWVHTRGAVIAHQPDGGPRILAGGIVNIQARKEAEEALRISQKTSQHLAQLLHSMCNNVPDMVWAKDLEGRYLFANRAICEQLLGAESTEEPLGRTDLYFAQRERERHPDNATWHTFGELCQNSDVATLQRGVPCQFEEWGNVKGQHLVLDVRKAPFVNEHGVVVGVVGTGRDVTEHQAEQDKLRLAALVLEHSSEALLITDEANAIVEVNPAFTRLTGYSREDALGQTPAILRSGRQGVEFYRRMWEALTAEGQWQGEIWNRRKDGVLFVEWLTINTLYDSHGQPHRRVALFSDVTEKKKEAELLWQQANYDLLTQLPNRRMFQDRLNVELKKLHRSGDKLAVCYLDLDHFKEVNDSLGHHGGDQLLVQAAQRILACVRGSDTVARLGGDEFTVILTDIESATSAERVAQAIVDTLSQPFDLEGSTVQVSASVGVAVSPDHGTEATPLLLQADQAMYAAKRAGRNSYRFGGSDTCNFQASGPI